MAAVKKIVILGGGFGGLRAARDLGRRIKNAKLDRLYHVVLVDQNAYQTYTPTLYEIATTPESLATQLDLKRIVTFNLEQMVYHLPVEVVKAKVTEVDVAGGDIHLESGTRIGFDYLVVALGSQVNYFNIPGLADHSYTLKSVIDALRLREKLIMEVEDPDRKSISIVVGGGGSTGVELASEIKLSLQHMRRIECGECGAQVTIVDGAATVLPPFGPAIIKRAEKRLGDLEIDTILNERIAGVDEQKITLQSGKIIPYDIFIWTGGVSPNMLMSSMRMKKDSSGTRVLAQSGMTCLPEREDLKFYGSIYGIGDAICFMDPKTGRPVPGVARAAIVQGSVVAHNIFEEIKVAEGITKEPRFKTYTPLQYPYIIPVGGKYAIARFGPFVFSGIAAWIVKGLVEGNYLFSILPFSVALRLWLRGLWIFVRNDRLG